MADGVSVITLHTVWQETFNGSKLPKVCLQEKCSCYAWCTSRLQSLANKLSLTVQKLLHSHESLYMYGIHMHSFIGNLISTKTVIISSPITSKIVQLIWTWDTEVMCLPFISSGLEISCCNTCISVGESVTLLLLRVIYNDWQFMQRYMDVQFVHNVDVLSELWNE